MLAKEEISWSEFETVTRECESITRLALYCRHVWNTIAKTACVNHLDGEQLLDELKEEQKTVPCARKLCQYRTLLWHDDKQYLQDIPLHAEVYKAAAGLGITSSDLQQMAEIENEKLLLPDAKALTIGDRAECTRDLTHFLTTLVGRPELMSAVPSIISVVLRQYV